mmetsp:Transcript_35135/g.71630  ORF Transcript_35135/g.71630 Transcript_35135/m.71630 type:complete len:80 (-) Transcript_35135:314-553(-)
MSQVEYASNALWTGERQIVRANVKPPGHQQIFKQNFIQFLQALPQRSMFNKCNLLHLPPSEPELKSFCVSWQHTGVKPN